MLKLSATSALWNMDLLPCTFQKSSITLFFPHMMLAQRHTCPSLDDSQLGDLNL